MAFTISYKSSVSKDLKRIQKSETAKILNGIEKKLSANPRSGKALAGDFKGLFRLRLGDYRVIYAVSETEVVILRIGHRKEIYR